MKGERNRVRASQVQTQRVLTVEAGSAVDQVLFSTSFAAIDQNALVTVGLEMQPEARPGKSHVDACWTVSGQQEELLALVKDREKCRHKFFNDADLSVIVNSIHYKGLNFLSDRDAMKRRSFKFLYYFVRQGANFLIQSHVACLLAEFQSVLNDPSYMSFKAKNYLILSLACVINNNQLLPNIPGFNIDLVLLDQLNSVYYQADLQYQPTIIFLLKALVKRNYSLTERDISYLLSWLDISQSFTNVVSGGDDSFREVGWIRTLAWLQERSVKSFKHDSETGVKLSSEAVKFTVKGWEGVNALSFHAKTAYIVYRQSRFVQSNFPCYERVLNCLEKGLQSHDIKVRDRSILALNNLLGNDVENRARFEKPLAKAMAEYRELALDVLIQHALKAPQATDKSSWRPILKPLIEAAAQSGVAEKAKYLDDFLGQGLDSQIRQLSDVNESVKVAKLFVDLAKSGVDIEKAVEALVSLIQSQDYAVEAKINALLALSIHLEAYGIKNNTPIDVLFSYFSEIDVFSLYKNSDFTNAALKCMACASPFFNLSTMSKVLESLLKSKINQACLINTVFLFSKLLERVDSSNEALLQISIERLLSFIMSLILDDNIKTAVEDLLYFTLNRVSQVQQSLLDKIIQYIMHGSVQLVDKLLAAIYQGLKKTETLILSDDFLNYLSGLFFDCNIQTKQMVLQIVSQYLSNKKAALSEGFLEKFSYALKDPELTDLTINILLRQVDYQGRLSQETLLHVFSVFEQNNPDHENCAVHLLRNYLKYGDIQFQQTFIDSIAHGLSSMLDAIYAEVLCILIKASDKTGLDFFNIVDHCIGKFSRSLSAESMRNFAEFLDAMSRQLMCYSVTALTTLSENLNLFDAESSSLAINFLEAQFRYHDSEDLLVACPRDYYQIFNHIERFVCQRIQDFSPGGLKKILSIFNFALASNYVFAKDSQLLLLFSGWLYTADDREMRDSVLIILKDVRLNLPEDVRFSVELDQIGVTENIEDALAYMQRCISTQKMLTKNNYNFLEKLLSVNNPECLDKIFQLSCLAIEQDILLPPSLLSALLNSFVRYLSGADVRVSSIVDEAIKRGVDLPKKISVLFSAVEEEFLQGQPSFCSLRVLRQGILHGLRLKPNTFYILLDLLMAKHVYYVALSVEILSQAVRRGSLFSTFSPGALISKLMTVTSINSILPLINALLESSEFPDVYKNSLLHIYQSTRVEEKQAKVTEAVKLDVPLTQKKRIDGVAPPDWLSRYFLNLTDDEYAEVAYQLNRLNWRESETRDIFRRLDLKNFSEISEFLNYLYISEATSSLSFLSLYPGFIVNNTKFTFFDISCFMLETHAKKFFSHRQSDRKLTELFIFLYQNRQWSAIKTYKLLVAFKDSQLNDEELQEILDILIAYKDISYAEILRVLKNTSSDKLYESLQALRLHAYMSVVADDKSIDQLLDETKYEWKLLSNNDAVKAFVLQVDKEPPNFEVYSKIIDEPKKIADWDQDVITRWAQQLRASPWRSEYLLEMLKVINHGIKHIFKHYLRHSQLLAILMLLDKPDAMGRIAEVATGEGKSHIIAAFAVIQALRGRKVDIVTSASTLAERDEKRYRVFYDLFGLKSASAIDPAYTSGLKSCYKAEVDVVYSDAQEFQFDCLRTDFGKLGTCGEVRKRECVIVDEVDNLLVDETSRFAMLADKMPGMFSLTQILIVLWKRLLELVEIKDGKEMLSKTAKKQLMEYIEALTDPVSEKIFIPHYLRDLVNAQKKNWLESACLAVEYQVGCQYEIKMRTGGQHEIIPIDASNTGMLQSGTLWQDGLHQFLQIKHGLKVDSECLTTNFMSNVSFFGKYGTQLYGITGTLGSEKSQAVLKTAYTLDCVTVPRHKERPFVELKGTIASSHDEWIDCIKRSVLREVRLGRPVLLICEFKGQAELFQELFELENKIGRVIPYYDNEINQVDGIKEPLKPGDIVVATNLAGRGTDLELTETAQVNGGLHVCVTFLPINQRVEDQAFGRAARKGEPGTAQLILEKKETEAKLAPILQKAKLVDCDDAKSKRDELEKLHLREAETSTLPCIRNKDELFKRYLTLRKQLFEHDKANIGWMKDLRSSVRNNFLVYKLKAADERWGIWLKQKDLDSKTILQEFDKFEEDLLKAYKEDNIIVNPHYYMSMGAYCLSYVRSRAGKYLPRYYQYYAKLAVDMYTKAIALCEGEGLETAFLAYYYRAYAYLKLDGLGNKVNAKQDIVKFIDQIQHQLNELNQQAEGVLPVQSDYYCEGELRSHLSYRIKLYSIMLSSAQQNLKEIEQSQKLADITVNQSQGYEKKSQLDKDQAKEVIVGVQAETLTVGFCDVKNAKDIGSNEAGKLFDKFDDAKYGIQYSSEKLGEGNKAKQALLNLLPINCWGKVNQLEKENELVALSKEDKTQTQPSDSEEVDSTDVIGLSANAKRVGKKIWGSIKSGASAAKNFAQSNEHVNKAARQLANGLSAGVSTVVNKIQSFADYLAFLKNNKKEAVKIKASLQFEFDTLAQSILWVGQHKNHEFSENMTVTLQGLTADQLSLIQKECANKNKTVSFSVEKHADHHVTFSKVQPDDFSDKNRRFALKIQENRKYNIQTILSTLQKMPEPIAEMTLPEATAMLNAVDQSDPFKMTIDCGVISQQEADALIRSPNLDQCKASLSFDHLPQKKAVLMSTWNRNHADNAYIVCYDLKPEDAIKAIDQVHQSEQSFYLPDHAMKEELKDIPQADAWFPESHLNGFDFLYTLQEKSPMPWRGIAFLLGAGLVQLGVGFLIGGLTFGIGFNVATAFVAEGIGEFIKAGVAAYTRSFSMEDYLKGKAMSVLIATVTVGISAIKAAVAAARAAAAGLVLEESAASAGTNLANLGIQAGRCVTNNAASGTFNLARKNGVQALHDCFLSGVEAKIKMEIDRVLYSARVIDYVKQIFAYDKWLNTDFYSQQLREKALYIISQLDKDDYNTFEEKLVDYLANQFKEAWSLPRVFCEYLRMSGYALSSVEEVDLIRKLKEQGILHDDGISLQTFAHAYKGKGHKKYDALSYDYEQLPFKQVRWRHTNYILSACLGYGCYGDRIRAYACEISSLSMPLIGAFLKKSESALDLGKNIVNTFCNVGNSIAAGALGSLIKDKVPMPTNPRQNSDTQSSGNTVKKVSQGLGDIIDDLPSGKSTTSSKSSALDIINSISLGLRLGVDAGSRIYIYKKLEAIEKEHKRVLNNINNEYWKLNQQSRDHKSSITGKYYSIFEILLIYIFKTRCLLGFLKQNYCNDASQVDQQFNVYCDTKLQEDLNNFEQLLEAEVKKDNELLTFAINYFDNYADQHPNLIESLIKIFKTFYQLKNQKEEVIMGDKDKVDSSGKGKDNQSVGDSLELVPAGGNARYSGTNLQHSVSGAGKHDVQIAGINAAVNGFTNLGGQAMQVKDTSMRCQAYVMGKQEETKQEEQRSRQVKEQEETKRHQSDNAVIEKAVDAASSIAKDANQLASEFAKADQVENRDFLLTLQDRSARVAEGANAVISKVTSASSAAQSAKTNSDTQPALPAAPAPLAIADAPAPQEPAAAATNEFAPLNEAVMDKISDLLLNKYGDSRIQARFEMKQEKAAKLQGITIRLEQDKMQLAGDEAFIAVAEEIANDIHQLLASSNYQVTTCGYNQGELTIRYKNNSAANLGNSLFTLFKNQELFGKDETFENNKTFTCAIQ